MDQAFRLFQQKGAQTVFCLGDLCHDVRDRDIEYEMEVICVAGNMDYSTLYPVQQIYEGDGLRFLLTHGHTFDVYHTHRLLLEEAERAGCQAVLYGHTHVPCNTRENGILVLNPGSAAEPRGHSRASAAIIDTASGFPEAQVYWLEEVKG